MKRIILILLLQVAVCSPFYATDPPKDSSLDFLSDLPELKGVALHMPEDDFKGILTTRKLRYDRSVANRETAYYVHIPTAENEANVYFGFRGVSCTGIQRLQPSPKQ